MRSPRTALFATLALVLAGTALLVTMVLLAAAGEREQAEGRFTDRAETSASLASSLFAATSRQNRGPLSERLGQPGLDRTALDDALRGTGVTYAGVFDEDSRLLTTASGTTSANVERMRAVPPTVKRVLRGEQEFNWSEPLTTATGPVVEVVTRLETTDGDRVLVRGYPLAGFGPFLAEYLAGLPGADEADAYVVDSTNGVIASPVQPQGRLRDAALDRELPRAGVFGGYGEDRHLAVRPVANTPWRVVITEPDAILYEGVSGVMNWILLGVAIFAGLAAAALMRNIARAKSDLRRTYDELEVKAAELRRSNVELTRSNAELEQFASVASHDLQEPLRKVQTFGDQLERRFGDDIPPEAKDYLRRMRRASARMSTLIEDLLRFSRVTTHARTPRQVDLSRVAREVAMDLENQRETTHGSIEIGVLPTLEAEPHQMRQLLQNLIGNGLKFHRPGTPPVVGLEAVDAPDDEHVAFSVTDNGIGFEPVYAERIFRVFERLHPRDVYEGTGIGLALCRKIVERHGGSIVAAAEPDAGARFVITLPRVQPEAEAAPEPEVAHSKEPVGV